MKISELRGLNIADIEKKLAEARKDFQESKRALAAGELPNPRVVGNNRRSIAQLNTVLNEQRRAESQQKGDA